MQKYREASARDSINAAPPEARIISRASPSLNPAYPKKLPTVLIVAFAGFALSAGFTVTGALLGPPPSAYPYQYAAAGYGAGGYAPQPTQVMPFTPRMASPPLAPMSPAGYAAPPQGYSMPPNLDAGPAIAASAPFAHFAGSPGLAPDAPLAPMHASSIEEIADNVKLAGDAARCVGVVGAARNVGTTFSAITLARSLAEDGTVVLVDLAFGAPNLSVISTDPQAPGIADMMRGTVASFGDIITRDQYSNVNLVATGEVGNDADALAASPMLATVIEALAQSYDHVVLDLGSAADAPVEYFAALSPHAVLVTGDTAHPSTRATREGLQMAGFADVSVCGGGAQMAAA